jgi:two-component system chemotaxis response regulator CheB
MVVIGGSAGSIGALKTIVSALPANLAASLFVVIHTSSDSPMMLAGLLSRLGPLAAVNPSDGEPIRRGHIYVSRPDHHLTVEDGRVRVLRGPRENRHRPAIDPLFRTAARTYGSRVIGVILSGFQDDGSAGLYAVRERGGIAIAQDPNDAAWRDMPAHAIEYVRPQYVLPAAGIAPVLVEYAEGQKSVPVMAKNNVVSRKSNGRNGSRKAAAQAVTAKPDANKDVAYADEGEGRPSVFACPECHGVLWELKDGEMVRFRCRVGHSFGTQSLSQEISMASEAALWAAVRALEEKSALQRRIADTIGNDRRMSARALDQSESDSHNARVIRDMIFQQNSELRPEQSRSGNARSLKNILQSPESKTA